MDGWTVFWIVVGALVGIIVVFFAVTAMINWNKPPSPRHPPMGTYNPDYPDQAGSMW